MVPLAGAAAGALVAVAGRGALLAARALARWLRGAREPMRRAGREGYSPSTVERRRLATLATVAAIAAGWFVGGAWLALPLAVAGPALTAWVLGARKRR